MSDMKSFYQYLLIIIVIAFVVVLIFLFQMNERKLKNNQELIKSRDGNNINAPQLGMSQRIKKPETGVWHEIDKMALEISREICKQEQSELSTLIDPSLKNLKPGDIVPLDSEDKQLSPSQAIEWLIKTANSKCSSFRKNNAERFFHDLNVDERNYKAAFSELMRFLEENRGFTPYRLIRKALQALDKARGEEAESLKKGILFSLNAYIEDASSHVDIVGVVLALEAAKERGLIAFQDAKMFERLQKEHQEISNKSAQEGQALSKKYFTSDKDFRNLTSEKIVDILGYKGVKEQVAHERKNYDIVRRFSKEIKSLLKSTL